MELRGNKWGAQEEENKPAWPAGTGTPGAPSEQGDVSQWWPEPGNGAGGPGEGAGASRGARWGLTSNGNGAPIGPGGSGNGARANDWGTVTSGGPGGAPGPGGALPPGSSPAHQSGSDFFGADVSQWVKDGRPPVATGQPRRRSGRPGGGPAQPQSKLRRAWQRFVTALAAIGAFLAKFGALLIKLKYVGLVLSMVVSVVAYSLFFGWSFAVGIVLLILVHEMGHVVELRRQGVPASAPLFIPFLGAFVNMRGAPRSAYQEALSGLAGPLVGTAASVVVAFWANATSSNFLMALAFFGFFVNLFNLLPVLPLDGGRAAAALHPALWLLGLTALIVFEVMYPSPVIPIVLVLGGLELWRRWRYRNSPSARAYNALLPKQRFAIGIFYVVLVAIAIFGAHATYVARSL